MTAEVCRHGISEQIFYRWKSKNGGMEPFDAQRLKGLEWVVAASCEDGPRRVVGSLYATLQPRWIT
tara:strand:+ start:6621 stop:6818 length:198 start_codon:yes stop_codon:yes gene_type:complete